MQNLIPEKMEELIREDSFDQDPEAPEFSDVRLEEDIPVQAYRHTIRPEGILALLTGLLAAIFIVLLLICLPHIQRERGSLAKNTAHTVPPLELSQFQTPAIREEDPEPIIHETQAEEESPEDGTEPTIPPEGTNLGRGDFQYNPNNYLICTKQPSYPGIDVSAFQGDIDWQQVKESGIRFAIIRLGYRGYETGKLVEDEYAEKNLKGAVEAGLPIGAYFFSQALNTKEVDQEIDFMLEILGETQLDMPIILDWEIPTADARTAKMDARTLTDLQLHFCAAMEEKGYVPMVYFNWHMSKNLLYLNELEDYPFWLALYQDRMTYPYKVELWQYTDQGRVPGINANVDINVYIPDLNS